MDYGLQVVNNNYGPITVGHQYKKTHKTQTQNYEQRTNINIR